jgi:hypothetical protein
MLTAVLDAPPPFASIGGAFLLGAGAVVVLLVGAFVIGIVKGTAELPGKLRANRERARRADFVQGLDLQRLMALPRRTKLASNLQCGDVLNYFGVHVIERIEQLPGGYIGVHAFDGPVSGIPPDRPVEVARERVVIPTFID